VEWIVGTFVVLGFIAIIVRFVPRDDAGRALLPAIVDNSIAMWALRRVTGRSLWERPEDVDTTPVVGLVTSARRAPGRTAAVPIAVPGHAGRFDASRSRLAALGIRSAGSARQPAPALARPRQPLVPAAVVSSSVRRRQAHPTGSLAAQRRLAGMTAILVVGVIAVVVAVVPGNGSGLRGGVLGETSQPIASGPNQPGASAIPGQASDSAVSASSGRPTVAPGTSPTRVPVASRSSARPTVPPSPRSTAVPTPRPTPKPTPKPTHRPGPSPTPTPPPTVPPTPTPTDPPSATPS
jgi:hypothetical protein